MKSNRKKLKVVVSAEAKYIDKYPDKEAFIFSYDIVIENQSTQSAQIISRHWKITDANNQLEEVKGTGVIGLQPNLLPGESFRYTSSAVLPTSVGMMEGKYFLRSEDGNEFSVRIPPFMLAAPNTLQ